MIFFLEYKCDECDEVFPRLRVLKKHIAAIHNVNAEHIICEFCGCPFGDKKKLSQHVLRAHTKNGIKMVLIFLLKNSLCHSF